MENIAESLTELVGKTPLVRLSRFSPDAGGEIVAKLEAFNPGWSVKDRLALGLIEAAEKSGKLKPGGTIIEPTSGNTGIGLAWIAAIRGYKLILTMPESMSIERRKLLSALGAELVLTSGKEGMAGAIAKAEILVKEIQGAFLPQQFENPANPETHYRTTGTEIWEDTGGKVDAFVAGVGTGGTLTGVGKFLKEKNPKIKIFAVEPEESPVLSGEPKGPHLIQGIGAGFIPPILDQSVYDEVIRIPSHGAIQTAKTLCKTEGIIAGISSGAAALGALQVASRPEFKGKRIVTLFPDTGERYISTLLFYQD